MQTREYRVKLFPPGKKIIHNGNIYTVDHVRICKGNLFIKFVEYNTEINSKEIDCEPTVLILQ